MYACLDALQIKVVGRGQSIRFTGVGAWVQISVMTGSCHEHDPLTLTNNSTKKSDKPNYGVDEVIMLACSSSSIY